MENMLDEVSDRVKVFNEIVADLGIPEYIKHLLAYSGFNTCHAMSLFTENDFEQLEVFAKSDLVTLLDEEEKRKLFGIYYKNIPLFKIVQGHRKLIEILVKECQKQLAAKPKKRAGPILLDEQNKRSSKKSKMIRNISSSATSSAHNKIPSVNDENVQLELETQSCIQKNIIQHVKRVVQSYQEKFLDTLQDGIIEDAQKLEIKNKIKDIQIEIKDQCVLVHCIMCNFISKAYSKNQSNSKQKWILSNVNRHFRTHFNNSIKTRKPSEQSSKKNRSILEYIQLSNAENNPQESILSTSSDSFIVITPENVPGTSQSQITYLNMLQDITLDITSENPNPQSDFYLGRLIPEELNKSAPNSPSRSSSSSNSSHIYENNHKVTKLMQKLNNSTPRSARTISKRQLVFDPHQTQISDFFEICKDIKQNIFSNETLSTQIKTAITIVTSEIDSINDIARDIVNSDEHCDKVTDRVSDFLDMLKDSAVKNSKGKGKQGHRFSEELKRFSLYLFIVSGKLAYETLSVNLKHSLPSITTLHRTLSNFDRTFEDKVDIEGLKSFLLKRNYPLNVFISKDQTAIVKRIRYNPITNEIVGCVPSINTNGFPKEKEFQVNSVTDIKRIIDTGTMAINAYVYMAQPLVDKAPAFCVAMFGSNNTFKSDEVLARWNYIRKKSIEYGITIQGFSSDGDTRCLGAMKTLCDFPKDLDLTLQDSVPYEPYFKIDYDTSKPVVIQDTVHIGTKIKTRILKPGIFLPMGDYCVSKSHLEQLIDNIPKDQHLLTAYDLDGRDKMNFNAIQKLSDKRVTELLKSKVEFSATRQINGHGLLLLIEKCRSNPKLFVPWIFSSQPCEKFFRQARSMTSTYSTIVNFDMLDLLQRKHRIQAINDIISDSGKSFTFPRENNFKLGVAVNDNNCANTIPEVEKVKTILEDAKNKAIDDSKKLNMILTETEMKLALETISIQKKKTKYTDNSSGNCINVNDRLQNFVELSDDPLHEEEESENEENNVNQNVTDSMHQEDSSEINEDLKILSKYKSLDIKDYSQDTSGNENSESDDKRFLKITVNNKTKLVRKSTLCWLFCDTKGHLSSDRLIRCRGMSSTRQIIPKKKINKNCDRNQGYAKGNEASSTTSSDSSLENAYHSLSENENYTEVLVSDENEDDLEDDSKESRKHIEIEKYYCVYYDTWYIGRVIDKIGQKFKIKFLKSELDHFVWPKTDDVQLVEEKYIFYGPIELLGNTPFTLKRCEKLKILNKFKHIK